MMLWSVTLLAFTLAHGTTATMKSEAELLESNGWKEMDAAGNPLYKTLASKAASNFTKHIDFYQVLNEVISVHKKGEKHRIEFTYSPTPCSVQETFDSAKCKAVTPKKKRHGRVNDVFRSSTGARGNCIDTSAAGTKCREEGKIARKYWERAASGECTSMFTVKENKAESAVLDWVNCNDFMAPKRRRYPEN